MYDLGDSVLVTTNPTSNGNPVDVAGLQLIVALPDGTSTSPLTPAHDGTGEYSYSYVTSQPGRHVAKWAGTGYGDTSVFNVWPADPRMLFDLDTARSAVWQSAGPADDDDFVRLTIAAVTEIIEDITGPLLAQSGSITADGGSTSVFFPPGATVTSVLENGSAMDPSTYTVNTNAGIVYAGSMAGARRFLRGLQNVVVTYALPAAAVPSNVLLAALEEFRFLYFIGQEGNRPGFVEEPAATEWTPSGFAVPRRVIELCAGSYRTPVIA